MTSVFIYLLNRLGYRVKEFFEHWYLGSFRIFGEALFNFLRQLDTFFALRVTLRHFFEPLYQDRTFLGYLIGIPFRSVRVVIASVIYLFILILALSIYFLWLGVLPFILYKITAGFLLLK